MAKSNPKWLNIIIIFAEHILFINFFLVKLFHWPVSRIAYTEALAFPQKCFGRNTEQQGQLIMEFLKMNYQKVKEKVILHSIIVFLQQPSGGNSEKDTPVFAVSVKR
jgi:hypothetical protein